MCSMSVLCPLCAQTSFANIDALRISLIKAANGPLACPICSELFLGLDKLTIHLFSHTSVVTEVAAAADTTTTTTNTPATTNVSSPAASSATAATTTTTAVSVKATKGASSTSTTQTKRASREKKKKLKQLVDTTINDILEQTHIQAPSELAAVENSDTTTAASSSLSLPACDLSTCDICEFTFRNEQLRDMHFRLVHQNFGAVATNSAGTATLTPHAGASEPEFKCHLCAKTFKMKGSLRVHLKVVHLMGLPYVNNSPKLSICDRIRHKEEKSYIPTSPSSNAALNLNQGADLASNSSQIAVHSPALLQQSPHIPNGFSFGTLTLLPGAAGNLLDINANGELIQAGGAEVQSGLNSNVLLVFNTSTATISALSNDLDKDAAGNKVNAENPKIWECDVCTKSFTTKYFLKKHKRLHTGEMPYTCEICARTFTFQQSYHKHLLYHSNEKPHVCATCGRAFKELSTLHNHERIHSGEKPFKCEVCGKCFRQRVSFLVHTRIHTGVMPYKCELCQKSFRYKVSQRTHKCLPKLAEEAPAETNAGGSSEEATAEQISESFIKAFLESTTNTASHAAESQNSPASAEIATITADSNEALLTKTIDDFVAESCNKLGIGGGSSPVALSEHVSPSMDALRHNYTLTDYCDGSNSPTQRLQNMRLYSPQLETDMESGDDGFPRFLLDHVGNSLL